MPVPYNAEYPPVENTVPLKRKEKTGRVLQYQERWYSMDCLTAFHQ